ncbi:MAG: DUF547 domain-containing protein [Gammaproteobacteria bacterium]|nr:DUF547 domain-containing protein [Gammaproteobacteria bacterium]
MFRKLLLCISFMCAGVATAQAFDHQLWDDLLKRHVVVIDGGQITKADYAGFQGQRQDLKQYLDSVAMVSQTEFDNWSNDSQLAYLINVYNAWTVELILTKYPDLDSIKALGSVFRSPWKKTFIPLFGQEVSLDHIEHDLIRGSVRYNEPRIHFAVNCASIGCPALRNEAYTPELLDAQLEQQTQLFLQDKSRNRLDGNRLMVSEIFKWYRKDFEQGWRNTGSLTAFLALYGKALGLDSEQQTQLQQCEIAIDFLGYDWQLNDAL